MALVQAVDRLRVKAEKTEDDLRGIIAASREGRACYGAEPVPRAIWLMNEEIGALDRLARYEEARAVVDLFFDEYVQYADTSPFWREYQARLHAWQFRYASFAGEMTKALGALIRGRAFANALPPAEQANVLLDGATYLLRADDMEEALSFVQNAERVLAPLYATTAPLDIRRAWGRARYVFAVATVRSIEKDLPPGLDSLPSAERYLQEAIVIFEEVRDAEHRALAGVAQARAHAARADTAEPVRRSNGRCSWHKRVENAALKSPGVIAGGATVPVGGITGRR